MRSKEQCSTAWARHAARSIAQTRSTSAAAASTSPGATSTAPVDDELGQAPAPVAHHRGAARHRLRGNQAVRLIPLRRDHHRGTAADQGAQVRDLEVTDVLGALAQKGPDEVLEIAAVPDGSCQSDSSPARSRDPDGLVGRLLRHDPSDPDEVAPARSRVQTVVSTPFGTRGLVTCSHWPAVCALTATNRARAWSINAMAGSNHGVGGVCSVVSIGTAQDCARAIGR